MKAHFLVLSEVMMGILERFNAGICFLIQPQGHWVRETSTKAGRHRPGQCWKPECQLSTKQTKAVIWHQGETHRLGNSFHLLWREEGGGNSMTQVFSYSWKEESSEEVSWRKLQFLSPELVQNVGTYSTPPKGSLSICHSLSAAVLC